MMIGRYTTAIKAFRLYVDPLVPRQALQSFLQRSWQPKSYSVEICFQRRNCGIGCCQPLSVPYSKNGVMNFIFGVNMPSATILGTFGILTNHENANGLDQAFHGVLDKNPPLSFPLILKDSTLGHTR